MLYNTLIYNVSMKLSEKIKALKLRKKGISYSEIMKSVSVSKSTLSFWLRDITLNRKQKNRILHGLDISRNAAGELRRRQRLEKTEVIIDNAKTEFLNLIKKPIFLVGLSLYLAEGDKNAQERVKFTNSDPKLISIMMRWFREICEVPNKKFRIALHIHNLHISDDVKNYWSNLTNIPTGQFYALYVKESTLRTRRNILYNGTCSVIVNSRDLFRRITGWRMALLDYFCSKGSM